MTRIQYLLILTVLFQPIIAFENIDSTTESSDGEDRVNYDTTVSNVSASKVSVTDDTYCTTNAQMELIRKAIIKLAVIEIQRNEFQLTWDFFEKINLIDDLSIELLINETISSSNYRDNTFNKLLQFINSTSNTSQKSNGYRVLFNHIVSNTSIGGITINWLDLQYLLSHDATTPKLQVLLNEVEYKLNILLDSSDFVYITDENSHYYSPVLISPLQYLIQRLCSTPSKIKNLFSIMCKRGLVLEDVLTFVTELERNNRFNYTLLVIPRIQKELEYAARDQKSCRILNQLIEKFPENSSYVKLLSSNYEFYIKSPYNNEYLYERQVDSSYNILRQTYPQKEIRIITSSSHKSKWKIRNSGRMIVDFRIHSNSNNGLAYETCPIHDELYVVTKHNSQDWTFEADDIYSGRFRIRIPNDNYLSGYLTVGRKHKVLITDDIDNIEANKVEWILEPLPNQEIKVKNKCIF